MMTIRTRCFPTSTKAPCGSAREPPTYLGYDMGIGKTRTFIEAVKLRQVQARPRDLPRLAPCWSGSGRSRSGTPARPSSSSRPRPIFRQPAQLLHRLATA